jgi:large subunit ribosomal protein L5
MTDDKKKHDDDKKEKKHAHGEGPVTDAKAHAEAKAKAGGAPKAGKKGGRKEKAPATITAAPGKAAARGEQPARLGVAYKEQVIPALMKDFGYKNPMQVPKVEKVVINMGLGEAITNNKLIEQAEEQMMAITGQKCVVTRSRKSIANFKLRENQAIGVMATLRKDRMYEFLDRLLNVALPRVRDFKGVSGKSFDGKGNYTLGIKEQIIFPEINYDRIEKIKGMNITIVTSAKSDEEGRALLRHMGMPFRTA